MWYTRTTKQFLPIGDKLWEKGISAARFLPGRQKRANTAREGRRQGRIGEREEREEGGRREGERGSRAKPGKQLVFHIMQSE